MLPNCTLKNGWWNIYSAIKKEHMWVSANEADDPRAYGTEWSKSERERQILYINTCLESRKMVLMSLFAGQQWRRRHREQTCEHSGGRRGWDALSEEHGYIHMTICKIDSQWEFALWCREFSPVLCDNLEGWDRVGCGKEVQEGVDICIPVADSCWCMAETNTIL